MIIIFSLILFNSQIFFVKQVDVLNNHQISDEEILLASGIRFQQTVFQIRPEKVEKLILKNPAISAAKIDVIIPNKVSISIKERVPLCLLEFRGQYACLSKNGIVMYYPIERDRFKIPIITGCRFRQPELGKKIRMPQFTEIEELMSFFNIKLRRLIVKIDLKHDRLYLQATQFTGKCQVIPVEFGNMVQIERKIANLRAILRQIDFKEISGIDLRVPDIPTVISKKASMARSFEIR